MVSMKNMTHTEWRLKMSENVEQTLKRIDKVADDSTKGMERLQGSLDRMDGGVKRLDGGVKNLDSSFGRFAKGAGILAGVALLKQGASAAFDFTARAGELKREAETLDNTIKFANGKEGIANLERLDLVSKRLGTNLLVAKEGYALLSSAAIGTKFGNNDIMNLYEGVTEALTATGRGEEDQRLALLAISQMMSKGNVQAEELRGQLGERIPGAVNIMARALGVGTGELNKMLERGEILAEDALPKFAAELRRTYAGALPVAMASARAEMGRIENDMQKSTINIGEKTEHLHVGWKRLQLTFLEIAERALPSINKHQSGLVQLNARMNEQFDTLRHLNPESEERKKLINDINAAYSPYLKNLLDEKAALNDVADAQKLANERMQGKFIAMVGEDKKAPLQRDLELFRRQKAAADFEMSRIRGEVRLKMPGLSERAINNGAGLKETDNLDFYSYERKAKIAQENINRLQGNIKNIDEQTYRARLANDRAGLLNEATSVGELARAMERKLPANISASGLADLIDLANQRYGSNVGYDTFGLRRTDGGGFAFEGNETLRPTSDLGGGSGAGGRNALGSIGGGGGSGSVRNTTVNIGSLAQIHIDASKANNPDELLKDIEDQVNEIFTRVVYGTEEANISG